MNRIEYKYLESGIVNLILNKAQSSNYIDFPFVKEFDSAVEKVLTEKALKGVIISAAGGIFPQGTDVGIFMENPSAAHLFEFTETFKGALRRLETLGVPVVSIIDGNCLGGAFELTLASHFRIALDSNKIRIGLPEIQWGLLSPGGGITRISRLVGLQKAFEMISAGKKLTPQTAFESGLLHALADEPDELLPKALDWIHKHPESQQPYDNKGFRIPGGSILNPSMAQVMMVAPAVLFKKTKGHYLAPEAVLSVLAEGSVVDPDTAFKIESRYFVKIGIGNVAQNMVRVMGLQLENLKKGSSRPDVPAGEPVRKVGVLGAGMMGHGIAYVSALNDYSVVLKDVSMEMANKGLHKVENTMDRLIQKKIFTAEKKDQVLKRILPTDKDTDLQNCDLIIEAVFENRELKAKVTQESAPFLSENGFFASNTSTLPITGLAAAFPDPKKFIGLHFFSPVDRMQLVEIIKGKDTSPETLSRAFDFVLGIKKIPIVVNDSRGFYTSRVFSTYVEEGLALLGEGQNPQCIESAGIEAGMPVGPLALTDEITLTLVEHINKQTEIDLKAENKSRHAHPADAVVEKMIHQHDRKGKSTGAGFYDYPQGESKHLWENLPQIFPLKAKALEQSEMIDRMMFIQAIETVRCLQEGVLDSVGDANIGSIFGWGFPAFKGGTLQFINDYGLKAFVEKSSEMKKKFGARFGVPRLLVDMAAEGRYFE